MELLKKYWFIIVFTFMTVIVLRPPNNGIDFIAYYTVDDDTVGTHSYFYTIEKEYELDSGEEIEGVPLQENEEEETKIYLAPKLERYKVKKGETLATIAKKNNISLDILKVNNSGIEEVKAGQVINIIKSNGVFYRVKKGDTLSQIVSKYGVDIDELRKYNNLTTDIINIGQELFILNPSKNVIEDILKENGALEGYKTFAMPVKWEGITSPFGSRFHPVLKRYIQHQGVDMKAKYVPLSATKDGVVTFAGYLSGYGKIIMINHGNGYETRSAHLNKIYVKKGQRVKEGEIIGETGMTGRVTGPHLHFEIRRDGKAKNPMNYLVR